MKKLLRGLLAALVFSYAPGPLALDAFAQAVRSAPVAANAGALSVVPVLQNVRPLSNSGFAAPLLPAAALPGAGLQALPAARVAATPAAVSASAQASPAGRAAAFVASPKAFAAKAALGTDGGSTLPMPSLEREGERAVPTVLGTLEEGTRELASARNSTARSSTLSALFEGMRRGAASPEPVAGSASKAPSGLAPSADSARADSAVPAPSKLKGTLKSAAKWALPIIALAAVVYGLDFATKALAVKYLFSVFHECAWRAPFMFGVIPYITGLAFYARGTLYSQRTSWRWSAKELKNGRFGFYRAELASLGEMEAEHPSLKGTVRLYDIAIALMLAGLFGNGLDAIRLGGALDWIPLGRSIINLADVALLGGLAFFQMASSFFAKARLAYAKKEPLHFDASSFLGLPVLGFFLSWALGSAPTEEVLNLALSHLGWVYVMGFSMLLGISRLLASLVLGPRVRSYRAESGVKRP